MSPQNFDSEILLHMRSLNCLKNLVLLQVTDTTSASNIVPCSQEAWSNLAAVNKDIKVYLRVESEFPEDVIFQPGAPIASITYNCSYSRVLPISINYSIILLIIYN